MLSALAAYRIGHARAIRACAGGPPDDGSVGAPAAPASRSSSVIDHSDSPALTWWVVAGALGASAAGGSPAGASAADVSPLGAPAAGLGCGAVGSAPGEASPAGEGEDSAGAGAEPMSPEQWAAGRAFFAPEWSFVALDRSSDRARIAGYLLSSRYEQDWDALGWKEGYTDVLGSLAEYADRGLGPALLAAAMRAYAASGMEYAAAGVDSASPTGAGSLYERLGYQPTRGTILYGLDV